MLLVDRLLAYAKDPRDLCPRPTSYECVLYLRHFRHLQQSPQRDDRLKPFPRIPGFIYLNCSVLDHVSTIIDDKHFVNSH